MQIRNRIKGLRHVPASELRPSPKNWRTHPKAQQEALRGILAEVGIAGAAIARELDDGSLELIDGHLRAETLPNETLPVLVLDVDEAEAAKLLATYDPLGAMAEADAVKLDAILREVDTGSEALQEMLAGLADDAGLYQDGDNEIIEDEAPEPPVVPVTQPGDLWVLGEHRLLCGDSTKADCVERLMAGAKADLCFTSPPYCVGKAGWSDDEKYNHGDDSDLDKWFELLTNFTSLAISNSSVSFINLQMVSRNRVRLLDWLHMFRHQVVDIAMWDKGNGEPAMQPGVMNCVFEFIFVLASGKPTRMIPGAEWRGTIGNVARITRGHNEFAEVHRAVYPVRLPSWGFDVVNKARTVLDPFCGSGTTLIAAEQLNRKCYGMEISPQYCDVIVKRWENLTGKKAERQPQ